MQGSAREDVMEAKVVARAPSGADSKKADGKASRFNRRKESNNGGRARNDPTPPRRAPTPKGRGYDKRPRSRGNANASQRPEVTLEPEAEYGSALQTGSKKGNLNHLLNFTFAPREHGGGWKNRNNWGRRQLKYNKEQFLQANCQFVVQESGDYVVHSADPDMLVDWGLIQQVRIQSHEVPNCPICLFPPVAAKMTRCGHIYCWVCILHYLALGEKSWRKCPICYESVHTKDLKSVAATKAQQYKPGDQITMVLMKRERGATYAMPKKQWEARDAKPHNVDDAVDTRFAKLLCATASQVQAILDEERVALENQLREEPEGSIEASFIKAAQELLQEREAGLRMCQQVEVLTEEARASEEPEKSHGDDVLASTFIPSQPTVTYASAFDEEIIDEAALALDEAASTTDESMSSQPTDGDVESSITTDESPGADMRKRIVSDSADSMDGLGLEEAMESLAIPFTSSDGASPAPREGRRGRQGRGQGSKMTDVYYFYQAEDGQHIYINSLNARCLMHEYGSLEHSPDSITATIVEVESVSMNEELRRKLKYLSHLPLTCEFKVAELALRPPILSSSTIKAFSEDIEKRRRARQRKVRMEKKISRKMQDAEDRKDGLYPGMHSKLSSSRHFPAPGSQSATAEALQAVSLSQPSSEGSTPIGSPPAVNLNPFAMEFHPGSPYTPSSLDDGHQTATVSFAQMLRQGKAKPPETWPKAMKLAEAEAPKVIKARADSDDSDPEDRVPVPTYQASFGDAIQEALNKYSKGPDGAPQGDGGRKKKKKQKKLLFTTSMARK